MDAIRTNSMCWLIYCTKNSYFFQYIDETLFVSSFRHVEFICSELSLFVEFIYSKTWVLPNKMYWKNCFVIV